MILEPEFVKIRKTAKIRNVKKIVGTRPKLFPPSGAMSSLHSTRYDVARCFDGNLGGGEFARYQPHFVWLAKHYASAPLRVPSGRIAARPNPQQMVPDKPPRWSLMGRSGAAGPVGPVAERRQRKKKIRGGRGRRWVRRGGGRDRAGSRVHGPDPLPDAVGSSFLQIDGFVHQIMLSPWTKFRAPGRLKRGGGKS